MFSLSGFSQTFSIARKDSVYELILTTGQGISDRWKLSGPVYQFQTGDVNGDGHINAMVGVIRKTRFHPMGKRLFIFKNVNGRIRPLWMGSKLGGILVDFRFIDGKIRSLETTTDNQYVVAEYQWDDFGMSFIRFLAVKVSYDEAISIFNPVTYKQ